MIETRIIGGVECVKPTSVMAFEKIRKVLEEKGSEAALREIDCQIEHHWVVDGFWRNVSLVPVHD